MPPGVNLNPRTGIAAGTPTPGGVFQTTFRAANAFGSGISTQIFLVAESLDAPEITNPDSAAVLPGQAFTYQVTTDRTATAYAATGLPPGLAVNRAIGLISGTPTAAGTYGVNLAAANAHGNGYGFVTFAVVGLPVLTSPPTVNAVFGDKFSYRITATHSPTNYTATGLPPELYLEEWDSRSSNRQRVPQAVQTRR